MYRLFLNILFFAKIFWKFKNIFLIDLAHL